MFRRLVVLLGCLFMAVAVLPISGCSDKDKGPIEAVIWDTNGGGDIYFTILRINDSYELFVNRYHFEEVSGPSTPILPSDSIYTQVDDIFKDRDDIRDHIRHSTGSTGTWTDVTLVYMHSKVHIEDVNPGDFADIYAFAEATLGS